MFGRRNQGADKKEKVKFNKESFYNSIKIFGYVKPYIGYFLVSMFMLFISTITFMVIPSLLGMLFDVAKQEELMFNLTLEKLGLIMIVILVIQGIASYARIYLTTHFAEKSISDIRKDVYKNLLTLPITFYEDNSSGDLISRLSSDIGKMYSVFSVQFGEFLRQILVLITGIGFLIITTPRLSLIMLATIPMVILLTMIFGRQIRKLSKKRQEVLAGSNSLINDAVNSIKVVKAFATEIYEKGRYNSKQGDLINVAIRYGNARGLFILFLTVVFLGAIFFIIYMGAKMVQEGQMTSGNLISFVTYTFIIGGAIAGLGSLVTELMGAIGATERVREILDLDSEINLDDEMKVVDVNGDINFTNVEFSYPSRKDIQVLKEIDLHIRKGSKVALVGPSGVGKSTIIQLLLKFYKINSGDITINGHSIYDIDTRYLRKQMSLVPQEVILFSGTIKENIKYGREGATDEEINEAAMKANALEFIDSFPEGMDTVIGERGIKLSGGQRQRIAIARAILQNPIILLLDEATSALDTESEKYVQEALIELMKGRTSIIIAHRLSTITDADCIYVFKEGQIIEFGTHQELMKIDNGVYHKQAQLGRLFESGE